MEEEEVAGDEEEEVRKRWKRGEGEGRERGEGRRDWRAGQEDVKSVTYLF
jgi:hypothetical protein